MAHPASGLLGLSKGVVEFLDDKIIRRKDAQLDVIREMHRPDGYTEFKGCRGQTMRPTAIRVIHRVAARSGQQEGYGSAAAIRSDDVLAHF